MHFCVFDYVRSIFVQRASIVLQCTPDVIFLSVILCWINPSWVLSPESWPVLYLDIMLAQKCHRVMCYMWLHVFHKHKVTPKEPFRLWQHVTWQNPRSSSHPGWPGCSSCHDELHLRQWLMGRDFHEFTLWKHWSASHPVSGSLQPQPLLWYMENPDSSLEMPRLQWRRSQPLSPLTTISPMHQSQSWTTDGTLWLISCSPNSVLKQVGQSLACRNAESSASSEEQE